MTADLISTLALAAAGLLVGWCVCARALASPVLALAVMAPPALAIPWTKQVGAPSEAAAFFASFLVLAGWMTARAPGGNRRSGFALVVAAVVIKPETVLLAAAAVLADGLVLERPRRWGRVFAAAAAVALAALAASLAANFVFDPRVAAAGFWGRVTGGTAWQSSAWIFAGAGARRVYKAAQAYDLYFYWPLAPVFALLALQFRREWWLGPLLGWGAIICTLTIWLVREPNLHACLPLQAAMVVPFAVAGAAALRLMRRSR